MTDLSLIAHKPSFIATLIRHLIDWLNEPVAADAPLQLASRDWADMPTDHPIRDDRGGR